MSLGVLPQLLLSGRLIHFIGLGMSVGAAIAALVILRSAARADDVQRSGLERAVGDLVSKVEIPGIFVAILGGILLVVARPEVFDPERSGAGPWLHIKLVFVMGALVVAHLRMFNAKRLVRERAGGASTAALDAMVGKGKRLDWVGVGVYLLLLFLVTFRVMLFA